MADPGRKRLLPKDSPVYLWKGLLTVPRSVDAGNYSFQRLLEPLALTVLLELTNEQWVFLLGSRGPQWEAMADPRCTELPVRLPSP